MQVLAHKLGVLTGAFMISSLICAKLDGLVKIQREAKFKELANDFVWIIFKQVAPEREIESVVGERKAATTEIWYTRLVYLFKHFYQH